MSYGYSSQQCLTFHFRYYEIAQVLIEHGADSNATSQRGFTILEALCRVEPSTASEKKIRTKFVELLCNHGAKLDFHSAITVGKHHATFLSFI